MPHAWALVDSSFPTFTAGENPQQQVAALVDYMMILTEALKYQLENLDTNNWNSTALDNFQVDTTKDVSKQLVEVAQKLAAVTNEVTEMKNRLSATEGRTAQVETDVSYLEAAQEEAAQKIAQLQEEMSDAQADFDSLQVETESLLEQMGDAQADIDTLEQETKEQKEEINTLKENVAEQLAAVKRDADGNVTLGEAGKDVYLTGNIYINGVLLE